MIYYKDEETGELYHYGIKGQRWGVRRYQNENGTYTPEGKERRHTKEGYKNLKRQYRQHRREAEKQYRQKVNESINNNFPWYLNRKSLKTKEEYDKATKSVKDLDSFAHHKSQELYNEYKNLKVYKANLKNKDLNKIKYYTQSYFGPMGIHIDEYGDLVVESVRYSTYNTPYGTQSKKIITRNS